MTLSQYEGMTDPRTVGERLRQIWGRVDPDAAGKHGLDPRSELDATMAAIRAAADHTLDVSGVTMNDLIGVQGSEAVEPRG